MSKLCFAWALFAIAGCSATDVCVRDADCPDGTACRSGSCEEHGAALASAAASRAGEGEGASRAFTGEGEGEGAHAHGESGEGEGEGEGLGPVGAHITRSITIPMENVPSFEPLAHFPLLVRIVDDPQLRALAYGGAVADDLGSDIAFFDGNGFPIAREIESYDEVAGSLLAWVDVPSLAADDDTKLVMAWGGPPATAAPLGVWDAAGYRAVWHLDDALDDGVVVDSTAARLNGIPRGLSSANNQVDGIVGRGVRFAASDESIEITSDALLFTGSITLEAWVRFDDLSHRGQTIFERTNGSGDAVALYYEPAQGNAPQAVCFLENPVEQAPWGADILVEAGTWHRYTASFDATTGAVAFTLDGVTLVNATSSARGTGIGNTTFLGNFPGTPYNLIGALDEVRVFPGILSDGRIATEYAAESDPTFIVLGDDVSTP